MQKQTLIAVSMLLGSGLIYADTSVSSATKSPAAEAITTPTTTQSSSSSDITKTKWLNSIVPILPTLICKGFMSDPDLKQRLETIKMNYDQCVSVLPESVSKCQNQLYANIPEKINATDAATWGKNFGECIGKDFAMKYLLPKEIK
ncbi:hypothetical protein [Legionella sp.]|uniref:hypothetical protein n=1 Tax=Legionella sp. TaxID=459 RepID=UPI003CA1D5B6